MIQAFYSPPSGQSEQDFYFVTLTADVNVLHYFTENLIDVLKWKTTVTDLLILLKLVYKLPTMHHLVFFSSDPNAANRSATSEVYNTIPTYSAEEERQDGKLWRTVIIGEQEHRINMKLIEPYMKVISHGGDSSFVSQSEQILLLSSGCWGHLSPADTTLNSFHFLKSIYKCSFSFLVQSSYHI